VGEKFDYGKRGVFGFPSKLTLKNVLICQNKVFCHRSNKMNLYCENKPSGGKNDPNLPNHVIIQLVFSLTPICKLWLTIGYVSAF
jgi:hypothetical protein